MVVLTNTCLAVLPALIFTEMVDYCSVFLLSQKIYDIVMVVFDLVNALVNRLFNPYEKSKNIFKMKIFHIIPLLKNVAFLIQSQVNMSKFSGRLRPPDPSHNVFCLKITLEISSDPPPFSAFAMSNVRGT